MSASVAPAIAPSGESWRRRFYRFRQSWPSLLGLAIVLLMVLVMIFGPYLVRFPEHLVGQVDTESRLMAPNATYWFGTNEVGQDLYSLVVMGTRVSLLAGLAVVVLGASVGITLGAIAGYFGGWTDEVVMRLVDLKLTIPGLILAMAVATALGPGLLNMVIAIAISWWPGYARLARGEVMAKKEETFVTAARALGAGTFRILHRHILPNILSPIIVKMSLDIGFAILMVASLGFIGIGVRPPTPEWGSLLAIARNNMPDAWWTAIFPGITIILAVFGFNLLGDGLRDVFDPKARR